MSISIKVDVAKGCGTAVHSQARAAATRVAAALKEVTEEAAAAGLDVRVTMQHSGLVEGAAVPEVDTWPSGDLADPSWRP